MNRRILLGVNIDHVATLREARGTRYPDPVQAALLAEEAGADGITIHPREDRRHIQDRDVWMLKETLQTRMNLEMAATESMLEFALKVQPEHCCLVPEKREELTTEGGLDVVSQEEKIQRVCRKLVEAGIEVSLFIDPDLHQIDASVRCGVQAIEIHTGHYADSQNQPDTDKQLGRVVMGVEHALKQDLIVNAGHGLHYHNTAEIAAIGGINELNIGHSIMARALFVGIKEAVKEMRAILQESQIVTVPEH